MRTPAPPGLDADLSFTELTGGAGHNVLSATPGPDLGSAGYREVEYAVGGTTHRYDHHAPVPGALLPELGTDTFTTRILVRRPERDSDFNGQVVVEWFNVSSGTDAAPEYTYLAPELIRSGYAWVGVSAQYTGIEGGAGSVGIDEMTAPQPLAKKFPERYGALHHPGDAYCYDIFGRIGSALRAPAGADHPLDGLSVQRLITAGESQSAMALTTYANVFANHHHVFDGIFIHSRSSGALGLGEVGAPLDIESAYGGDPVRITDDLDVPVFIVQTETDVLTNFQFVQARQPDSDRLRIWEIAGTSHADHIQIGPFEEMLGCPSPVNRGQQRFVLRAALAHLRSWIADDSAPPSAQPLLVTESDGSLSFELDAIGNVRDGVRTPCVMAPTQVLSGIVVEDVPRICVLFGTTTPAAPAVLAQLYRDEADYLRQYEGATDSAIAAGVVLAADRDEVLADTRVDLVPNR